jgi:PIN domain
LLIYPVDLNIARLGGNYCRQYRHSHGVQIADALIAATARRHDARLVTRNTKHFPMLDDVVVPYQLNWATAALVGVGHGHSLAGTGRQTPKGATCSRSDLPYSSFAYHLWMWLEDAGREYGVSIEPVTWAGRLSLLKSGMPRNEGLPLARVSTISINSCLPRLL